MRHPDAAAIVIDLGAGAASALDLDMGPGLCRKRRSGAIQALVPRLAGTSHSGVPGGRLSWLQMIESRVTQMSEESVGGRSMTAIVVEGPGGPEALRAVERPVPAPGPGELLLKVAAAGLNGADLLQRRGRYPIPPGTTDILGLECSGTVVALGLGAENFRVGDEVCALLIGGGYAEYVTVPAVQCLKLPRGVTLVEGGGIPEIANTVWTNVFEMGRLAPGESLLVHGG